MTVKNEMELLKEQLETYKKVVEYSANVLPSYLEGKPTSIGVDICIASLKKLSGKLLSDADEEALGNSSNLILLTNASKE